ncbi:MAG: mechanosensitive ion channel [Gammaproteobacteria bacterium]|nr:mechanosensitive ion channel [Gammaproteobacteria bacterium]MBT8150045.1 mechanosensitive ion channel [Gammaproteobacteria bacterium]NND38141.1 mechanosensitive ion channel [Pseudomonadales bacterium]NNM11641.1 mechanosensitive ion channel [Pseudomonadales bacterium]RZV52465.1 MAG: mechanosensitive ion channel [Pseudomonadales bacterium]
MDFNFSEIASTTLIKFGNQSLTVGQLIIVPLLLLAGYFVYRIGNRVLTKKLAERNMNQDSIHLIRRIFLILIFALTLFTVLDFLNIPITAFAFVSGAIAIGVGFGAQNIINNFISGWILMWERPIKIGDFLEVGDAKGTVESINTRSTRIRRVDGVHMLVPNSFLLENTVVNWTLVDALARTVVRVGVEYGSPVIKVRELMLQALEEHSSVLEEPAPAVIFEDFGDNALIFDAYLWMYANGDRGLRDVRSDLRFRIEALFLENNIVVAFPQRDVHLDGVLKISDTREEAARNIKTNA